MILNCPENIMNCKQFQDWVSTRDIHEAVLPAEAVTHMAECRECEALFHWDTRLEDQIKKGMEMAPLPRGLSNRIDASIDHRAGSGSPSKTMEAAGAAIACLVIILVAAYFPFSSQKAETFKDLNQISRQAVQSHLAGNRRMNFTAKEVGPALEILTKKLGFQVLLPNLKPFGCTLLGGRLCALGDCKAAYFVLEKNGRAGSLFIMDSGLLSETLADGSRFNTRIKGCETCVWKDNGQVYAMVF